MVGELTALERKRALEALLESSGWAILSETLREQVHSRIQELVLKPLTTLDESLAQEYAKGETASLQLVLVMPSTLLEAAAQDAAEQQIEEELANDHSTHGEPADPVTYPED